MKPNAFQPTPPRCAIGSSFAALTRRGGTRVFRATEVAYTMRSLHQARNRTTATATTTLANSDGPGRISPHNSPKGGVARHGY